MPQGTVLRDSSGNLYGTTSEISGQGTGDTIYGKIFKLVVSEKKIYRGGGSHGN